MSFGKANNPKGVDRVCQKKLCYVIDSNNQPLSPTKHNKGWFLVRNGMTLVSRLPFIINEIKKL